MAEVAILVTGVLALLVGAGELIGRYRDAPFSVLLTKAGITYTTLHGLAAALAYKLINDGNFLQLQIPPTGPTTNQIVIQIMTAAFGTFAFFRSSFFVVRMDGKDVGVGPALLWQTLLDATDRAVDRARAEPRSKAVREIMAGVDFNRAVAALSEFCFRLMQNVSEEERKAHASKAEELLSSSMDPLAKTYNLGLSLMNIVGEKVLREAVLALGLQIKGPARASIEVIAALARIEFGRDATTFAQACVTIAGQSGAAAAADEATRTALLDRVTAIAAMNMADQDKALILAIDLLNRFGDGVVNAALAFVGKRPG